MKIIIEGAGRTGAHLAKMLAVESNDITVIDADAGRIRELASQADIATIQGQPSNIGTLREAGCAGADLFIAVNPSMNQSVNIVSALLAKKLGTKRVVARIDNQAYLSPENKLLFKDMGLDMMFFPEKSASDEIVDMMRTSGATDTLDFARGKLQLSVFKLDDDSPLLDMDVKTFVHTVKGMQPDADFRIVALSRGGKTIIPKYDTTFKFHDYLYIISRREGMPILMKFLGKDKVEIRRVMMGFIGHNAYFFAMDCEIVMILGYVQRLWHRLGQYCCTTPLPIRRWRSHADTIRGIAPSCRQVIREGAQCTLGALRPLISHGRRPASVRCVERPWEIRLPRRPSRRWPEHRRGWHRCRFRRPGPLQAPRRSRRTPRGRPCRAPRPPASPGP